MLAGTIPPLSGGPSLPGVVCGVIDPNSPIAIFVDPRELKTRAISEDRRRDVPFPPPPPLPDTQPPGPCDWTEVELPNTGDACRDFVVFVRRLQVVVALLDLVNYEAGMDAMFVQYSYALRCVSARCAAMLGNQHVDLLNPEFPWARTQAIGLRPWSGSQTSLRTEEHEAFEDGRFALLPGGSRLPHSRAADWRHTAEFRGRRLISNRKAPRVDHRLQFA